VFGVSRVRSTGQRWGHKADREPEPISDYSRRGRKIVALRGGKWYDST